mmetsp:Transcript_16963/g.52591  ORF Transcript_16963/g.52591 Transcript_16963/m.52591 type:complete len:201 (-) Transcript_16963:122-724(-)
MPAAPAVISAFGRLALASSIAPTLRLRSVLASSSVAGDKEAIGAARRPCSATVPSAEPSAALGERSLGDLEPFQVTTVALCRNLSFGRFGAGAPPAPPAVSPAICFPAAATVARILSACAADAACTAWAATPPRAAAEPWPISESRSAVAALTAAWVIARCVPSARCRSNSWREPANASLATSAGSLSSSSGSLTSIPSF